MDKNGRFIVLILVFLIVSITSNASNSTSNSASASSKPGLQAHATVNGSKDSKNGFDNATVNGSTDSKTGFVNATVNGTKDSKSGFENATVDGSKGSENLTKVDPKGSENGNNSTDGIHPLKSKSNEEKGNVENTEEAEEGSSESCNGALRECKIEKTLIACIQMPKNVPKEPFLVLRNEGQSRLDVKLYAPTSVEKYSAAVNKSQTVRVNISTTLIQGAKIVVDAGNGNCELILHRFISMDSLVQQFSLYSKQVTPIYGAYFLFLVALVFGGTWACCKLSKKRQHGGGVPYQELEMGLPESSSAVNVETAEGWDQGWDDDWDDESAVKSPGGRRFGNISANGLTARSSKKDGWENDWDD